MDLKTIQQTFIEKFNIYNKYGFFGLVPFIDNNYGIGFSIKKRLNDSDNKNITLLQFSIRKTILNDEKIKQKPMNIGATYGRDNLDGVTIRDFEKTKLTDPIDIEFPDEYFYNIETGELYKNRKKITADKLINRVYNQHIKSTKPIKGFFLIIKLFLWWKLLYLAFRYLSKVFYFLLFLISGNRYFYEPIFKEEILNNKVIKTEFPGEKITATKEEINEKLKEGKKFNFFGYEASRWSIIFYSVLHLMFYIVFIYFNYKPTIVIVVFKNNFITLIYVIVSLWFMESVLPKIFMCSIRFFSCLSFNSRHKRIKI